MGSNKQIYRITIAYFVFGFCWIYFSDKLLTGLPIEVQENLQTYKGWIFVAVTTLFLFVALKLYQRTILNSEEQLEWKNKLIEQREQEKEYLERLSGELKEANEDLQSFSFSVTHDLKAPLRAISGYSGILYDKNLKALDTEDQEIFDAIKKSVHRLDALINNLLLFTRADKEKPVNGEVAMKRLFEECVAEVITEYPKVIFAVKYNDIINCVADIKLLHLVVLNLVSNAFKYSSKKPQPQIAIGCTLNGDMVEYYIKDNGTGFDTKQSEKLFKPFQRLHTKKEFEGTGLGLAIVERIITKHGGKAWAQSAPGEGSVFYFSLPALK